MTTRTYWCDICRGEAETSDALLKCKACPKRFHLDCAGLQTKPTQRWICQCCTDDPTHRAGKGLKLRVRDMRAVHKQLVARSAAFYRREEASLAPFVPAATLRQLQIGSTEDVVPLHVDGTETYINATLRSYQVAGANWILKQYSLGTGGILGDEMGLGKTIQTLTFLSALKAAGLPGPHLVVTPLAVLQNWANEIKRFTPGLTFVKIHGSRGERDRLLSDPAVLQATSYDVYLTTYDTFRAEEPFFTESFLFHTITIDEGHRLKNEASSLCASLSRISVPFRLLLTGTPLQNNLHELVNRLSASPSASCCD